MEHETFYVIAVNQLAALSSAPRDIGQFDSRQAAHEAARQVIDAWLVQRRVSDMTAEQLFLKFLTFGDVPSVFGGPGHTMGAPFNYTEYARARCIELCAGAPSLS